MSKEETLEIQETRINVMWKQMKNQEIKRFIDYIGPTGIWLLLYYVFSLFMMIVLNIVRIGWSFEAIFGAPTYFSQLFISYGLNAGKVPTDPLDFDNVYYLQRIDYGNFLTSASWLFAPMIVYVLGIFISMLTGSGFPQPIGDFAFNTNFQYFHQYVPLLNENKGGGFYFLIAWVPIILAIVIGAIMTNRIFRDKKNKNVNVIRIFLFSLIAGFIVGLQMGTITGTVQFKIRGAFRTIFLNSYQNEGYLFSGEYNPNTILITSWFINFIPAFMAVIWYGLYNSFIKQIHKQTRKNGMLTAEEIEQADKFQEDKLLGK
ncbi:MAG TPA: hypothetical protein VMZ29_04990 [Candidatus Bathyarchaeia archaeon]|nr:hypothetical protein [Candidatus Bathyarchaeia archaeon]